MSKLTAPMVEEFKDVLLHDLSRPMARAVLTSLKGIIRAAKAKGLIGSNPAEEVRLTKQRSEDVITDEDEGEAKFIGMDKLRAMLEKSADLWPLTRIVHGRWVRGQGRPERYVAMPWHPMFITAVFTGMRASELRGLAWKWIDFEKGVIKVRQRADRDGKIGPVKTEASRRTIPLAPIVVKTLKEWRLVCPVNALNLVFPSEAGRPILHTNLLNQGLKPLLKVCGIEGNLGYHALRHTAASLFIEQGWKPKKVQAVMGHASIIVTFDVYGHLFSTPEEDKADMAQLQARLLG